jgi:hypothetical protein
MNFLLNHVIEGKIEGTGIQGRRHKQLVDDLTGKRRYVDLKEEALDLSLWRTGVGRGYGPVVRQTGD